MPRHDHGAGTGEDRPRRSRSERGTSPSSANAHKGEPTDSSAAGSRPTRRERHRGQQPKTGGRDLRSAIAVGVGLIVVLVASLAFVSEAFVVVVAIAACLALWELAQALSKADLHIPLPPLWVGAVGIQIAAYYSGVQAALVGYVLTLVAVSAWRALEGGGRGAMRDILAGVLATTYIPLLASFTILMLRPKDGNWLVLLFIALCVANDTGGYFAGSLLGRHPLAPRVSPKKTWEGMAGSLLLAMAVGMGGMYLLSQPIALGAALGAVAVTTATIGDLAESLLKRDLGIKDMGTLLPGHGGILDRVDSILMSAPVAFLLLAIVLGSA